MRQNLIDRLVVIMSALLVGSSLVFALAANASGGGRVDAVLGLDADLDNGRELYIEFEPSCASCHSLRDADATSVIASDLDELQPSARVSVQSLLGGGIAGHDRENYEHILSNQQIADIVRYIEQVAGE